MYTQVKASSRYGFKVEPVMDWDEYDAFKGAWHPPSLDFGDSTRASPHAWQLAHAPSSHVWHTTAAS